METQKNNKKKSDGIVIVRISTGGGPTNKHETPINDIVHLLIARNKFKQTMALLTAK